MKSKNDKKYENYDCEFKDDSNVMGMALANSHENNSAGKKTTTSIKRNSDVKKRQ